MGGAGSGREWTGRLVGSCSLGSQYTAASLAGAVKQLWPANPEPEPVSLQLACGRLQCSSREDASNQVQEIFGGVNALH